MFAHQQRLRRCGLGPPWIELVDTRSDQDLECLVIGSTYQVLCCFSQAAPEPTRSHDGMCHFLILHCGPHSASAL